MTVANGLRCVSRDPTVFLALAHVAAATNGICAIICLSTPAAMAATWFPEGERIFAASIGQVRK